MGLDMGIYRLSKPKFDKNKVYKRSDINGIILSDEDIELPMFAQMIPFCQKIDIINQYYDMGKIRRDYGLFNNTHIFMLNSQSVGITDGEKDVTIPNGVIDEKYTLSKQESCYVCYREEVLYWRKAYDIQSWFYAILKEKTNSDVENTGYYLLTDEIIEAFNLEYPDHHITPDDSDDSALFYWEWY